MGPVWQRWFYSNSPPGDAQIMTWCFNRLLMTIYDKVIAGERLFYSNKNSSLLLQQHSVRRVHLLAETSRKYSSWSTEKMKTFSRSSLTLFQYFRIVVWTLFFFFFFHFSCFSNRPSSEKRSQSAGHVSGHLRPEGDNKMLLPFFVFLFFSSSSPHQFLLSNKIIIKGFKLKAELAIFFFFFTFPLK